MGGKDVLFGNGGKDTLEGGGGKDTLNGNSGHDELSGDNGRDFLDGGGGRDMLDGGKGWDELTGGGGADVFQFGRGDGKNTITDFRQRQDRIEIEEQDDLFAALDSIIQRGDDVLISFANVQIRMRATSPWLIL